MNTRILPIAKKIGIVPLFFKSDLSTFQLKLPRAEQRATSKIYDLFDSLFAEHNALVKTFLSA